MFENTNSVSKYNNCNSKITLVFFGLGDDHIEVIQFSFIVYHTYLGPSHPQSELVDKSHFEPRGYSMECGV